MTRFFGQLVVSAICAATTAYFGYYAIWGERGFVVLAGTQSQLAMQEGQLASLRADREQIEHRIQLLKPGSVDPDLVEELARGQMLGSAPGQVAVPRDKR